MQQNIIFKAPEPNRTPAGSPIRILERNNPEVGGEQRTHRPGVQLLGAPGRSRSGPLMEPQEGNQQQQHLQETNPRRRVTDRRSIGTDQDGPRSSNTEPDTAATGPPAGAPVRQARGKHYLRAERGPWSRRHRYRKTRPANRTATEVAAPGQNCAGSSACVHVSRAVAEEKPRAAAAPTASGLRKVRRNQGIDFRKCLPN